MTTVDVAPHRGRSVLGIERCEKTHESLRLIVPLPERGESNYTSFILELGSTQGRKSSIGGYVFKGLGNLQGMLRQAMEVKSKIEELKETLGAERIEASAGGGMVKVVINGKFELESIKIEPEIINKEEPEVLETLVAAAVNEGVRKTQELVKEKMAELTGGLDLPGLT
jgi:DNA-binding YbaB/EbfC family protein